MLSSSTMKSTAAPNRRLDLAGGATASVPMGHACRGDELHTYLGAAIVIATLFIVGFIAFSALSHAAIALGFG